MLYSDPIIFLIITSSQAIPPWPEETFLRRLTIFRFDFLVEPSGLKTLAPLIVTFNRNLKCNLGLVVKGGVWVAGFVDVCGRQIFCSPRVDQKSLQAHWLPTGYNLWEGFVLILFLWQSSDGSGNTTGTVIQFSFWNRIAASNTLSTHYQH